MSTDTVPTTAPTRANIPTQRTSVESVSGVSRIVRSIRTMGRTFGAALEAARAVEDAQTPAEKRAAAERFALSLRS